MVKKDHLALNLALNFANMGVKTGLCGRLPIRLVPTVYNPLLTYGLRLSSGNQGEDRNGMASNVKQAVIDLIASLPEDASVAGIMAELYFHRKVEEGLKQLYAGQGIDRETAKQGLRKWSR
jgi:hypothetical protein